MIVTLTLNTAVDRTLFVPSFGMKRTMRASRVTVSMGGKATDASYVLGGLGIPSLALGFAAGLTGQRLERMLHEQGVQTDFTQVAGETRVNTVIVDEATSDQATITESTLQVTAADVERLCERYRQALRTASCLVLGGAVPEGVEPSLYTELIHIAKTDGVPVVFDASGAALQAGIEASPDFVKPNRDELAALLGRPVDTLADAFEGAQTVCARYQTALIVTLGGDGALAVLPNRTYFIPPLPVKVVKTAGAGDAILAGLAAALARGQPVEDGLRLGFAAAAAVLLTPETAACRPSDVDRLLPQVELRPYP